MALSLTVSSALAAVVVTVASTLLFVLSIAVWVKRVRFDPVLDTFDDGVIIVLLLLGQCRRAVRQTLRGSESCNGSQRVKSQLDMKLIWWYSERYQFSNLLPPVRRVDVAASPPLWVAPAPKPPRLQQRKQRW